jgi:hypothetical protein
MHNARHTSPHNHFTEATPLLVWLFLLANKRLNQKEKERRKGGSERGNEWKAKAERKGRTPREFWKG